MRIHDLDRERAYNTNMTVDSRKERKMKAAQYDDLKYKFVSLVHGYGDD